MTGTSVQAIRWLAGQDQTAVWDVRKHTEKRTLTQNAYYWKLVGLMADVMRLPKSEVHNRMLRAYGQDHRIEGELMTVPIPDTEKAELHALRAETYHIRPTSQVRMGAKGQMFRTYVMMKGSKELTTAEFAVLLEGAIQEAQNLGIEVLTPEERAMLR